MIQQFDTWMDPEGNIYMQGGVLIDTSSSPTNTLTLSQGGAISVGDANGFFQRSPVIGGQSFQGGCGRNVISTGTLSGTFTPIGFFRQIAADTWEGENGQTMTFDAGTGDVSLDDGSGQIATMTGATIAPAGTFTSTAYGETNYNGGTPFTLTADFEGRIAFPGLDLAVSGSTAQGGSYTSTVWGEWVSDVDASWELTVNPAGDAFIFDGTDTVAERASGTDGDGSGAYLSTTYGATTYNSGEDFTIFATTVSVDAPMPGYLYVTVNLTAGTPTSLSGPEFASSMPSNSSTEVHIPVCYSTGAAFYPIQQGPILWR